MLFVHARTNSIVPWLRLSSLAVVLAVGLAFLTTGPGRGEEAPAYAIEVIDVTAKVALSETAIRDGYRILQSYNNRVIKLSAEDDGVAFEQEMVRAKIEEDALVFAVPLRAPSRASMPSTGFSVSATSMTATRWPWCRYALSPASPDGIAATELELAPGGKHQW